MIEDYSPRLFPRKGCMANRYVSIKLVEDTTGKKVDWNSFQDDFFTNVGSKHLDLPAGSYTVTIANENPKSRPQ